MRRVDWLVGVVVLFAGGASAGAMACVARVDLMSCSEYPAHGCPGYDGGGGGSGGGSGGSGGGSSSTGTATGGSDSGPSIVCAGPPTPPGDGGTGGNISDECAVFVQADSAAAVPDGSMVSPYKTLTTALANTNGKQKIFACNDATPFGEAVTLSAELEVYGGFDCSQSQWTWSGASQTSLMGPADAVALTITAAATNAQVSNFAIMAASPSTMTGGGSSIAVAVDNVTATLRNCTVTASDAADGVVGQTSTDPVIAGANAPAPDAATENACLLSTVVAGGTPGEGTCGTVNTNGGAGGKGGIPITSDGGTSDSNGQQGAAGSPISVTSGIGGAGQSAGNCASGGTGNDGANGTAGPGGSSASDAISLNGITNSDATDGQPGTPGQGGGGGGGAKSGTFCGTSANPADGPGASGGGGGAGGCGGLGGGGGKAGGNSIAIVSLGTNLTLTAVTVSVGKGGKGGNGVLGQGGGASGDGANGGAASGLVGSAAGCQGGSGGAGGSGGPGGGGRGGHAIGIAYANAPATMPAIEMFTPDTAGNGGTAGSGAPASSNGANGAAEQCWDVSKNAACL